MNELSILEHELLENPIKEIFLFLGILIVGILLRRIIAITISKYAYKFVRRFSHNQFSDEFVALARKPVEQIITLLVLYFAFVRLKFPDSWALAGETTVGIRWFILVIYKIAVLAVGTKLVMRAADFVALVISNNEDVDLSKELIVFLKELAKVGLILFAIFAGLRFIFNINITAIIASLGIGGLAVALAAQDTLANLLGSFIIYLDSPFKQGDNIEFGETSGTVEHVGFRTTRIRTFNKSLLIVPNKKIVDSILNNITSSSMRRVRFEIGLTYQTSGEQMRAVVRDIQDVINKNPHTSNDSTVKFTKFADSSLIILVSYFVDGNEYEKMVEVREAINFRIMEIVNTRGCEFAFPTQSVFIEKDNRAN